MRAKGALLPAQGKPFAGKGRVVKRNNSIIARNCRVNARNNSIIERNNLKIARTCHGNAADKRDNERIYSLQNGNSCYIVGKICVIYGLETIFAPLQAALLALAIRRKFMR